MAVPLLDLKAQHQSLVPEFRAAFERTLDTCQFVLPAPAIGAFEGELAAYCGTRFALGLTSGTDALLVAMMALDIGPGDEVIVPPFTFFCTAGCVARLGATPVFVDIDPATFNIDPAKIEAAITPRTKAIVPVHLFGQCAPMDAIMAIARKHGLRVIEDAAQAIAARHGDRRAGSIGDIGCLSFYPTKNLAALGDAGAVVTSDPALHQRMTMLRIHGQSGEYEHAHVGGNFRLDGLKAAMLSIKLPHLDRWTDARRAHAQRYRELLAGLPVELPTETPGMFHVYNQYTLRVGEGKREALRLHLREHGIGCRVYYPLALHLQPCFRGMGGKPGDFPESERASKEVLSIPVYPEMTQAQQDEVAAAIRRFYT